MSVGGGWRHGVDDLQIDLCQMEIEILKKMMKNGFFSVELQQHPKSPTGRTKLVKSKKASKQDHRPPHHDEIDR